MPESFMARPTDVLVSYLAQRYGMDEQRTRRSLTFKHGRLAMGLEIITVMRLLEDHEELVAHSQEAISLLQTLLNDQGLEYAHEWYERLNEWRRLKLDHVGGESEPASDDAGPSADA